MRTDQFFSDMKGCTNACDMPMRFEESKVNILSSKSFNWPTLRICSSGSF